MKYYCPKCYHIKDFVTDTPSLDEEKECPMCSTMMEEMDKQSKNKPPMWSSKEDYESGVKFFMDAIKQYGVTDTWKMEVEKNVFVHLRIRFRWEFFEALKRLNLTFEIN